MEEQVPNGTASNGTDQLTVSNEWVHEVTREGIQKEEILTGYTKWVSHSDYESVGTFIETKLVNTKKSLFKYTENFTTKKWKFSDINSDIF